MKTKKEILAAIESIRERRDGYQYTGEQAYTEISNGMVRILQWVLEYKIGKWYWCTKCQRQHKGLRCSKCGNEALKERQI